MSKKKKSKDEITTIEWIMYVVIIISLIVGSYVSYIKNEEIKKLYIDNFWYSDNLNYTTHELIECENTRNVSHIELNCTGKDYIYDLYAGEHFTVKNGSCYFEVVGKNNTKIEENDCSINYYFPQTDYWISYKLNVNKTMDNLMIWLMKNNNTIQNITQLEPIPEFVMVNETYAYTSVKIPYEIGRK